MKKKSQTSNLKLQGSFKSQISNRAGRPPFWSLRFGVLLRLEVWSLVLCLATLSLKAQTTPTPAPSNRYLLVVDTSRAMQTRVAGVQKAVQDLLASGMSGQMRRGDTLGVWTFNSELYKGQFPLQKWSPETKAEIILHVVSFLKTQKYEKRANLDKVLPTLEQIIQGSEFITVIIVSDGDEKIHGTPFDARINGFYDLWRDQQRKAQMPILTVLRAGGGRITHFAMNTAPWPVEMPPLPPEILALVDAEKNAARTPPRLQTSTVPNLIVSGKKIREEQAAKSGKESPAAVAPVSATGTNPPASVAGTEPPARVVEPPLTPKTATPTGQNPAEPVPPAKTESVPAPVPVPKPETASVEPVKPVPNDPSGAAPKPLDAQSSLVQSTQSSSTTPAAPAPKTVAAMPPGSFFSGKIIWIAGLILVAGAMGVVVLLLRRPRAAPPVSLITRSLEREKKP